MLIPRYSADLGLNVIHPLSMLTQRCTCVRLSRSHMTWSSHAF